MSEPVTNNVPEPSGSPSEGPSFTAKDIHFMRLAIEEAQRAPLIGEVPVGAVVVQDGKVIARAHNMRSVDHDPSAHAELIAMRMAAKHIEDWRLEDCTVYVTLEPCPMCSGAMVLARIQRCVYGCTDPKAGYMGSLEDLSRDHRLNHQFPVTAGVEADQCSALLRTFFRDIRTRKKAEKMARRAALAAQAESDPST